MNRYAERDPRDWKPLRCRILRPSTASIDEVRHKMLGRFRPARHRLAGLRWMVKLSQRPIPRAVGDAVTVLGRRRTARGVREARDTLYCVG